MVTLASKKVTLNLYTANTPEENHRSVKETNYNYLEFNSETRPQSKYLQGKSHNGESMKWTVQSGSKTDSCKNSSIQRQWTGNPEKKQKTVSYSKVIFFRLSVTKFQIKEEELEGLVGFIWHYFGSDIGLEVRVFTNGPGDLGSIPGRVIPKTQKMVLDTSLLNTQHYKVRIKGKVEQSRERSSALPYTLV